MRMSRAVAAAITAIVLIAALAQGAVRDGRIPFEQISAPQQARVRDVVEHAVFERGVRNMTFRSREAIFRYFLDHLDFAAATARALKVANYQVRSRGDGTYWGDDTRGAKGVFETVYADPHKRVVHAQGTYDGRWLPTIHARLVLIVDFEHQHAPDGHSYATFDVKGYLCVDNRFLDALARLVGPIVVGAVDRKVARTAGVAAKMSERAHDDPGGFLETLRAYPGVAPAHLVAVAALLGRPAPASP